GEIRRWEDTQRWPWRCRLSRPQSIAISTGVSLILEGGWACGIASHISRDGVWNQRHLVVWSTAPEPRRVLEVRACSPAPTRGSNERPSRVHRSARWRDRPVAPRGARSPRPLGPPPWPHCCTPHNPLPTLFV